MKRSHRKENLNFWDKLPKPFFTLAPMANVTDSVFRRLISDFGGPDVMWTEFVSADGLVSDGFKRLKDDLVFHSSERPIVAQLFSGHPDAMEKAVALVAKMGFDGIDINMGCPDRAVEKQGGGAAMMRNYSMALKVIEAARHGANLKIKNHPPSLKLRRTGILKMPISVKTRLGYNSVDWKWIETLLGLNLPALTVHLRTRKEMSDVPAHWDLMPKIVAMRDKISPQTKIIGNGDVQSLKQAAEYAKKYGCDGVMIGRGIFGTPWLFESLHGKRRAFNLKERSPKERLLILVKHAKSFEKAYCGKKHIKSFDVMKKHFKAYVSGWDGAKELRVELMGTHSSSEVAAIVRKYLLEKR